MCAPAAAVKFPRALDSHQDRDKAFWLLLVCLSDLVGVAFFRLHEGPAEEPHILLECDSSVLDAVQSHLKRYKIRRKVDITPCPDLSLWAVLPGEKDGGAASPLAQRAEQELVLTPDPRTDVMGWRLIAKKGANVTEVVPGSHVGDVRDYHRHRYKQGKAKSQPGLFIVSEGNACGLSRFNYFGITHGLCVVLVAKDGEGNTPSYCPENVAGFAAVTRRPGSGWLV